MPQQQSRFGLNLFLWFVLFIVFAWLSDEMFLPEGLSIAAFLFFSFGLVYGFCRLFGVRGGAIETLFQNFPYGFWEKDHEGAGPVSQHEKSEVPQSGKHESLRIEDRPDVSHGGPPVARKKKSFRWRNVFTFRYLRYAGFLLVISSIFALLFQIEWELVQKIALAFVGGALFLVGAEFLHKKEKKDLASASGLVSFVFFQFGLSLLYSYFAEAGNILADPLFWLGMKSLLSVLFLFTLFRYPAKFQAATYFFVSYLSPLSLAFTATTLATVSFSSVFALEYLIPTLALLSLLVIWWAMKKKDYGLLSLNVLGFNALVFNFSAQYTLTPLVLLTIFFIAHLGVAVAIAWKERKEFIVEQIAHNIFLHVITLWQVVYILDLLRVSDVLHTYRGVVVLGFALLTFVAYMFTQRGKIQNAFTDVLLNTSIIVSAVGLFLQIEGPWTAIVFLVYSCLILWYGIARRLIRTIIYGFVFLTLSIIKLYLVSPEIFETFTGSSIVLVIGLVLIFLSYKFEKIKDYVEDLID